MSSRHAVVVSYLALFIALGGTATALQGRRSVQADDLATNAVTERSLRARSVGPGEVQALSIETRHLSNGSIGRTKFKRQSIDSRAIINRTVESYDLGVQSRIDFPQRQAIIGTGNLTLVGTHIGWAPTERSGSPFQLIGSVGGGGGALLDGSLGPRSGFLEFRKTSGQPSVASDSVGIYSKSNSNGDLQLIAVFPGGTTQVLATAP